jgi:tRNA threonylcarbamoyladenosine modification (KEOPS) complex Cgi121 subunit
MPFCYLDDFEIAALERVMKRLYTEQRMDADCMRDCAHTISAVLRTIKDTSSDDFQPKS